MKQLEAHPATTTIPLILPRAMTKYSVTYFSTNIPFESVSVYQQIQKQSDETDETNGKEEQNKD